MIISCPACATRFTVGPASIPPEGRKVRCAKCGHTWHQAPEDDNPLPPPRVTATEERPAARPAFAFAPPEDELVSTRPAKSVTRRVRLGWPVFAAAIAICAAGLTFGRDSLVALWPSAVLLYDAAGFDVPAPGAGLRLPPPKAEVKVHEGTATLVLEGQILNPSDRERAVPSLRAIPTDPSGKPLEGWTMEPSLRSLLPGEIATYRGEHAVSGTVAEITVTFF
jgi:predicted Zn finger-like uncharacterized protein